MQQWKLGLLMIVLFISGVSHATFSQIPRFTGRMEAPKKFVTMEASAAIIAKNVYKFKFKLVNHTEVRMMTCYANETAGVFLVKRVFKKGVEGYGIGEGILTLMASKGAAIEKSKNFDSKYPYVIRWYKNKYIVHNDDYALEKMFRVLNQYFYFRAIKLTQKQTPSDMQYTAMELQDSITFPSLKPRRWKGSKAQLKLVLPLVSEALEEVFASKNNKEKEQSLVRK